MSAPMPLSTLLAGYAEAIPAVTVSGLQLDSRRIARGELFLACRGSGNTHGLQHLAQAQARGAVALAWEPAPQVEAPQTSLPQVAVPALARRAGEIAARFYGQPGEALFCTGITGTDGKTSTAYLLAQALETLGQPCGYIGTIGLGRVGALDTATHTTPDPVQLQARLAAFRDEGLQACAMEVSSHALDQSRVAGLRFDTAVLSNITRDHLDYHGTVERYAAAKRRLFEQEGLRCAVLNRDDEHGACWLQQLAPHLQTTAYGIEGAPPPGHYVLARDLALSVQGIAFTLDTHEGNARVHSGLLGRFNVYNLAAVAAVLLGRGEKIARIAQALSAVHTVPGRMEGFRGAAQQPLVIVDYAHTPEALQQILRAARAHTTGKLSCVFGCGGDRDRGKRPLMGAAAQALADRVIVTDDNPRSEAPQAIVADILAGMNAAQTRVVHERSAAIAEAIAAAGADDVVVIAGKGHEDYQIIGSERRSFSDRAEVARLLGLPLAEHKP
ncbi:UDP-N-acetylmuramoylalanyl-D-glutamate--2,6-diaminopimelate ligase [Solimonas aquatica]|uniref:UDP-N-acetylmuramoyl-L-alanyl-D-glutamate--2,6-diaminopimelate ligase n=1 Tax=Solimonas aquatica TaxID=489703 RepID=A0A1H9K1V2_9GAMM|nr:UDP-N-acetylmuramoyl-L-alanyl-D-glutamate--2,6-diaminopimelate ligase [Solimonas aquatica]SEQ92957.1 UDP-N-acetylmuramoylalanyl-D-glutamate--2,6-diaminopimelate ligase [Solimonas aquatica]